LKSGPTQDAYLKLAEEVARQIAIRNSSIEKTEVVEIKL
jgi:ATP-binding protein involved in chromosome partitioning